MCVLFHVLNSHFVCHRFIVSTNNWIGNIYYSIQASGGGDVDSQMRITRTKKQQKKKKNAEKNETEQVRMEELNAMQRTRAWPIACDSRIHNLTLLSCRVHVVLPEPALNYIDIYILIHVVRLIFCVCFSFIHSFHCCPSSLALPSALFAYTHFLHSYSYIGRVRWIQRRSEYVCDFRIAAPLDVHRQTEDAHDWRTPRHATAQTNSSYVFMAFRC